MTNEKMREEFESAYVEGLVRRCGEGFRSTALYSLTEKRTDGEYKSYADFIAWWAWQTSRESLAIELPEKDPAGTGPGDCGDGRPSEEQYIAAHCNVVLAQCRKAIEAAGLKVKS